MTREIVYVDPLPMGHRIEHLAFYLSVCASAGLKLRAMVPQKVWTAAAKLAGDAAQCGVLAVDLSGFADSRRARTVLLGLAEDVSAKAGGALVVFPVMDDFILPILVKRLSGRPFGAPWTGVFFRDGFNYAADLGTSLRRAVKSQVKIAALRLALRCGANALITLNKKWRLPIPVPVIWLPDALSSLDKMAAKAAASYGWPLPRTPSERRRFLLFGSLEDRKGLVEFVEAALALDDGEIAKLALCVLGRFVPGAEEYRTRALGLLAELSRRGAQVEIDNSYVSEDALDAALRNCDWVLAPYTFHQGSSGVVNLAAQYGRPVLSQHDFQVGEEIRDYDLGVAVNCVDPEALLRALRTALASDAAVTPGMRRYREERSPEMAAKIMHDALLRMTAPALL